MTIEAQIVAIKTLAHYKAMWVRVDSFQRRIAIKRAVKRGAIADKAAALQMCARILATSRAAIKVIDYESFTQRRRLQERRRRQHQ